MSRILPLELARVFLTMHLRDRQAIVFSFFFPVAFMLAFGLASAGQGDPIELGLTTQAEGELAARFVSAFREDPRFVLREGSEDELRAAMLEGELQMILVLPPRLEDTGSVNSLRLLVDWSQGRQLGSLLPAMDRALVRVERELRSTSPLFDLAVEDVKARPPSYLNFLVPGLLAFTLMQISISGSGFNLVEYRRKGILKRLFVTPLRPGEFILGLVIARLVLCLVQLSFLLAVAVLALGATIAGSYGTLYGVIVLGTVIFLSLGFCLGSLAKTQQAILALGNLFLFPQMLLSGVFLPIDSLPEIVQPLSRVLPLTFVADALRSISVDGASIVQLGPQLLGLGVWLVLSFALATRLFVWKEIAA